MENKKEINSTQVFMFIPLGLVMILAITVLLIGLVIDKLNETILMKPANFIVHKVCKYYGIDHKANQLKQEDKFIHEQ